MRIVVKECEKFTATLSDKEIHEYLLYLMTDDNIPIKCDTLIGTRKEAMIKANKISLSEALKEGRNVGRFNATPVDFYSFEEFV